MKQIRQRLTYANVMSSLAVFLILGGATAFAATKIGANQLKANSVKTGKIVKEAVTTSKLKNSSVNTAKLGKDAVTSEKIADSSVGTADLANGAVTGAKIANGTVSSANLAANAQPTQVASMQVQSTGAVLLSTPGVAVKKIGTGAYCVGLPFAASGGAVSTRGDTASGTTAQTTVPADGNCAAHPGFQSATVYTLSNANALTDLNWSGIFR